MKSLNIVAHTFEYNQRIDPFANTSRLYCTEVCLFQCVSFSLSSHSYSPSTIIMTPPPPPNTHTHIHTSKARSGPYLSSVHGLLDASGREVSVVAEAAEERVAGELALRVANQDQLVHSASSLGFLPDSTHFQLAYGEGNPGNTTIGKKKKNNNQQSAGLVRRSFTLRLQTLMRL